MATQFTSWLFFFFFFFTISSSSPLVKHLQTIPLQNAAMVSIAMPFPDSPSPVLLITTFNTFVSDYVFIVKDLMAVAKGAPANVSVLIDGLAWPNQASLAPKAALPEPVVLVAGGFLVPGKMTGKVVLYHLESKRKLQVSKDKGGFFYHKAVWADMNGDGRLDILTARASRPILSSSHAEMVWMEQPENANEVPWPEHVMFDGPGHNFVYADWLHGATPQPQIISAGFFAEQDLALYICDGGLWPTCPKRRKVIIDDSLGPYFNVQKIDLNGDGHDDLLATNNRADGKGAVLAYEFPADGLQNTWTRHTLASGYAPQSTIPMPGQGAPGTALAFYPQTNALCKPWILVSGDDSGLVQLLIPDSQSSAGWSYQQHTIMQGGCQELYFAPHFAHKSLLIYCHNSRDIDGVAELFIADYSGGKVEMFSLNGLGNVA